MYNLKVHWKHSCEVGRILKRYLYLGSKLHQILCDLDFQMSKKCWSLFFIRKGVLNGCIIFFLLKIISQKFTNAVELYHIGLWFFSVLVGWVFKIFEISRTALHKIKCVNTTFQYITSKKFHFVTSLIIVTFVHTMFSLHSWWLKSALQRYKNLSKNNFCITDQKNYFQCPFNVIKVEVYFL